MLNKINVPKDLVRNERRWDEAGKNVDEKTKELIEWISFKKTFHVINVKKELNKNFLKTIYLNNALQH